MNREAGRRVVRAFVAVSSCALLRAGAALRAEASLPSQGLGCFNEELRCSSLPPVTLRARTAT
jgi:hypothetical protein